MPLTEELLMFVPGLCSRWVRLPSGARAHYVTAGETGPAVVLLHGGMAGSSGTAGWQYMAPFLGANGFRVYCPDMPAFGLTADPAGAYRPGPAGHLEFLHDFVNTLCLDTFHLAGNSMGCTNTVNYVVAHPQRVISFALVAGLIGDLAPRDELIAMTPDRPKPVPFDGSAASMRSVLAAITADPARISDDLVAMRTAAANRNHEAYQRHSAAAFSAGPDEHAALTTRGRLDRLTVPGIYLYGQDDAGYPVSWGYRQEDALATVQFFYPPNCGHQGQTDQPDLFNQVFLEFFRDGRVSRDTADLAGVSRRRPEIPSLVAAGNAEAGARP